MVIVLGDDKGRDATDIGRDVDVQEEEDVQNGTDEKGDGEGVLLIVVAGRPAFFFSFLAANSPAFPT